MTIRSIKARLDEHNEGLSRYTKTDKPWRLIYFETFYCKMCAEKREEFLKSGFGYKFRLFLLKSYLQFSQSSTLEENNSAHKE